MLGPGQITSSNTSKRVNDKSANPRRGCGAWPVAWVPGSLHACALLIDGLGQAEADVAAVLLHWEWSTWPARCSYTETWLLETYWSPKTSICKVKL